MRTTAGSDDDPGSPQPAPDDRVGPEAGIRLDADFVLIVDDGRTVVIGLPADPTAVRSARRLVAERWSWLDDDTLGDVAVVVSELVSNAVRHGRPEIQLRLRVEPFAVDVAVLDHGDADLPEVVGPAEPHSRSGRGLAIVDTLSDSWGVEHEVSEQPAKLVWATLSRAVRSEE